MVANSHGQFGKGLASVFMPSLTAEAATMAAPDELDKEARPRQLSFGEKLQHGALLLLLLWLLRLLRGAHLHLQLRLARLLPWPSPEIITSFILPPHHLFNIIPKSATSSIPFYATITAAAAATRMTVAVV